MSIFFLLLTLSACSTQAQPLNGSSQSEPAAESESLHQPAEEGDVYPMGPGGYTWLDGGTILAVQDGATIRYVDLDNRLQATVTLPNDSLPGDFRLLLCDGRILAAGVAGDTVAPAPMTLCQTDGEWVLANAAMFDDEGVPLREFPVFTESEEVAGIEEFGTLSDGRVIAHWQDTGAPEPVWINSDLLALGTRSRLFFYRLSTDTLTLVDDMSAWMAPYGKMQAYYGVERLMPYGEGCYYFVHRNEEAANTAGSVWYADEHGARELFDGQEFSGFASLDDAVVLVDWDGEGDAARTRIWHARADKEELVELAVLQGFYAYQRSLGSFVTLADANGDTIYLIGSRGGMELLQPGMAGFERFDLLGVQEGGMARRYLYAAYLNGEAQYYLISSGSEPHRLTTEPYLSGNEQYHKPMTHFVERLPAGDPDHAAAVRVCPMDPLLAGVS